MPGKTLESIVQCNEKRKQPTKKSLDELVETSEEVSDVFGVSYLRARGESMDKDKSWAGCKTAHFRCDALQSKIRA